MNQKSAVIQIQGHQYLVAEGQQLLVDRIDHPEGQTLKIDQVLLTFGQDHRQLGSPHINQAQVALKILEHTKGTKLHAATYKAKSRYRKKVGHRSLLTKLQVESISS